MAALLGTLIVVAFIALPAAIWFWQDALVARVNPWMWAVWGLLSVAVPSFLLFRLEVLFKLEKPWDGIIFVSVIAIHCDKLVHGLQDSQTVPTPTTGSNQWNLA